MSTLEARRGIIAIKCTRRNGQWGEPEDKTVPGKWVPWVYLTSAWHIGAICYPLGTMVYPALGVISLFVYWTLFLCVETAGPQGLGFCLFFGIPHSRHGT